MTDSTPSAVGRSAVLERTAELAALEGLVADLRPGTGRVAVVQGPPGIGKTTLVFTLHQAARGRGLPLSTARGTELGMDISFRAAREFFVDSAVLQQFFDLTLRISGGRGLVRLRRIGSRGIRNSVGRGVRRLRPVEQGGRNTGSVNTSSVRASSVNST